MLHERGGVKIPSWGGYDAEKKTSMHILCECLAHNGIKHDSDVSKMKFE